MKVDGKSYRTIWLASDGWTVEIIDQTRKEEVFLISNSQEPSDITIEYLSFSML